MTLRSCLWLVVLLLGGWLLWNGTARRLPPAGVAVPEEPVQGAAKSTEEWPLGISSGYYATSLASYRIRARVLGVKRYYWDRAAAIAPRDLVLGWGVMSDPAFYGRLDISQRGRFYVCEWGRGGPRIERNEVGFHSSNNHLIPADAAVADALSGVRLDDIVCIDGDLVQVRGPSGFRWRSSLTRTDTGDGACEVIRVTALTVESHGGP